ncbi:MAG: hypothetical protein ACE5E5_14125 [Phycisphaerae bacterium]
MLTLLLFENLWLLSLVLIAVQVVLMAMWYWRRTVRSAHLAWFAVVVSMLLMLTSWWVVTDREAVAKRCGELVSWVESEDIGAIESALAAPFEADGMDRVAFAAWVRRGFRKYDFAQARLSELEIRFPDPHRCISTFRVGCRVESPDSGWVWIPTRWEITWITQGDRPRMVGVKPVPTAPLHLKSLHQMFR